MRAFASLCFTQAVRLAQVRYGKSEIAEAFLRDPRENKRLDTRCIEFISSATSFVLATSSLDGWPHAQHRGGPVGFVSVDEHNGLSFDDLNGNAQFISLGNLSENPRTHLLFIDYWDKRRLKVWGLGRVLVSDCERRVVHVDVQAWDWNCSRHIPDLPKFSTFD